MRGKIANTETYMHSEKRKNGRSPRLEEIEVTRIRYYAYKESKEEDSEKHQFNSVYAPIRKF
jgi:hypothetical protein